MGARSQFTYPVSRVTGHWGHVSDYRANKLQISIANLGVAAIK
jgi:hypothetical protein